MQTCLRDAGVSIRSLFPVRVSAGLCLLCRLRCWDVFRQRARSALFALAEAGCGKKKKKKKHHTHTCTHTHIRTDKSAGDGFAVCVGQRRALDPGAFKRFFTLFLFFFCQSLCMRRVLLLLVVVCCCSSYSLRARPTTLIPL